MVIQVRGCWKILCLIHSWVLTLVIMMTKYIEPLHWVVLLINKVYYCLGLPLVIKSVTRILDLGHSFLYEVKFSESMRFILQWFLLQGALISLCDDDYVHLWNLRQAHPALVQSLRFNREKWVVFFQHLYCNQARMTSFCPKSDELSVRKYDREIRCKRSWSRSNFLYKIKKFQRWHFKH